MFEDPNLVVAKLARVFDALGIRYVVGGSVASSFYGVAAIVRAFHVLAGVPTVDLEDRDVVLRALAWHADGMDFADALHLAGSAGAEAFATFDRGLVKAAKKADASPPVIAP